MRPIFIRTSFPCECNVQSQKSSGGNSLLVLPNQKVLTELNNTLVRSVSSLLRKEEFKLEYLQRKDFR